MAPRKKVLMAASGDLRQSANETCWPAQAAMESQVTEALAAFRKHKINLSKIESRPSKRRAWEYFFFIDCTGHYQEPKLAKAIEELGKHCHFVKILGSYPNTE